jgi:hypothetical protein
MIIIHHSPQNRKLFVPSGKVNEQTVKKFAERSYFLLILIGHRSLIHFPESIIEAIGRNSVCARTVEINASLVWAMIPTADVHL